MPDDNNLMKALEGLQTSLVANLAERIAKGEATAADLSVARQLLKDNNITVTPQADPNILRIHEALPFEPRLDRAELEETA